jgi:hypothetical protein
LPADVGAGRRAKAARRLSGGWQINDEASEIWGFMVLSPSVAMSQVLAFPSRLTNDIAAWHA